jgi:hypothetical protein
VTDRLIRDVSMEKQLPTYDEVVASLRSPKPALACRMVELEQGIVKRSATVIFDGRAGWYIESEGRVEFRPTDDRVLLDTGGTLRCFPDAHSNGWVKTPIQGDRMSLDEATGRVLGREEIDHRSAIVAEFKGLRRSGDDIVFRFHVDEETGVVLRMSREDMGGLILRVDDFRVATMEDPGDDA